MIYVITSRDKSAAKLPSPVIPSSSTQTANRKVFENFPYDRRMWHLGTKYAPGFQRLLEMQFIAFHWIKIDIRSAY